MYSIYIVRNGVSCEASLTACPDGSVVVDVEDDYTFTIQADDFEKLAHAVHHIREGKEPS